MWQQMEQPADPELYDIPEITARPPDVSGVNSWEIPSYSYAGWYANALMGEPGYNWAQTITVSDELLRSSDVSLYHHTVRRVHATQLCQTALKPILAAGGITSSISTQIVDRGLQKTQYHLRYEPAHNLVQPLNQALAASDRQLKLEAYDGEHYSAPYFMDRFADDGTFLFSIDPYLNEHDLLYHGLGWLALPDSIVIGGFQKRARQLAMISDKAEREHEQIQYMRQLDHGINVIAINSLHRRVYASNIAQLAMQSVEEVRAAQQQHLYGPAA